MKRLKQLFFFFLDFIITKIKLWQWQIIYFSSYKWYSVKAKTFFQMPVFFLWPEGSTSETLLHFRINFAIDIIRHLKTLDGSFHRRFTQFSLRFTTTFCLVALNQPKTYPGSQRLFIRGFWFRVSLVAWVFGRRSIGLRREKKTPFILRVPEEN